MSVAKISINDFGGEGFSLSIRILCKSNVKYLNFYNSLERGFKRKIMVSKDELKILLAIAKEKKHNPLSDKKLAKENEKKLSECLKNFDEYASNQYRYNKVRTKPKWRGFFAWAKKGA